MLEAHVHARSPRDTWQDACGSRMTQIHRTEVLLPLAVGASAVVSTILIHSLALSATISFVRHERRLGRAGASFWIDVAIVSLAVSFALVAHLLGIALWAVLFIICGEFSAGSGVIVCCWLLRK